MVTALADFYKGVQYIEVLEDDSILGKKGKMPIMKYHCLGVTIPPKNAKILATSKAILKDGSEAEIVEAVRYQDGSFGIQGHPEEGIAAHIIYNILNSAVCGDLPARQVSLPAGRGLAIKDG